MIIKSFRNTVSYHTGRFLPCSGTGTNKEILKQNKIFNVNICWNTLKLYQKLVARYTKQYQDMYV
jgi:hypothetical protein